MRTLKIGGDSNHRYGGCRPANFPYVGNVVGDWCELYELTATAISDIWRVSAPKPSASPRLLSAAGTNPKNRRRHQFSICGGLLPPNPPYFGDWCRRQAGTLRIRRRQSPIWRWAKPTIYRIFPSLWPLRIPASRRHQSPIQVGVRACGKLCACN